MVTETSESRRLFTCKQYVLILMVISRFGVVAHPRMYDYENQRIKSTTDDICLHTDHYRYSTIMRVMYTDGRSPPC